jgi:hypothetical protein
MSELQKFNSNPGNPTQIFLNTENNYNSPDDNNENVNANNFLKLNIGNNKKNYDSSIENFKNNNINNISNNPNISIFNNFIFSLNKKTYAKSSSSKLFNISKNIAKENNNIPNSNIELNQNDIQSPIINSNSNSNTPINNIKSNIHSIENTNTYFNPMSPKELNSCDNYFSNNVTRTESNNIINPQNFNSNGSWKRFDTQGNSDSNAFEQDIRLQNKQDSGPIKILDLEIKEKISQNKNYFYPKQYFSLGYIFIILACKSIKLKVFEYLENFSLANLEEVKNYNLKKCCLFHFLISLEEGLKINKKFSIENFFRGFSQNFNNFICNVTTISLSNREKTKKRCLNGNHIYSLNAKSLQEHPWVKSENNFSDKILNSNISNLKITMKEVIKIVRESFKTSLVEFNEKRYENVLNKLEIILTNHKNDLKVENIRNVLATKQNVIKKLSCDLGLNYQNFYDNVCALVDKIFMDKE